ncbi:hypothetical protein Hanom_Chr13g01232141 [Helianthus anomalus]
MKIPSLNEENWMEFTRRMKMARFKHFGSRCEKKTLDESRKTCQTSGTKMAFYSNIL